MIEFHGNAILLDIEGTTSSIQYVHEVLFPFARKRVAEFLQANWQDPVVAEACERIAADAGASSLRDWLPGAEPSALQDKLVREVHRLMDADAKATGLKALQGLIWDRAYRAGQLQSHLFDDVVPALKQWTQRGLDVAIYSSGSIAAQKAYFSHTPWGNLLPYFRGHYDTTIGSKRDSASYARIAVDLGRPAAQILFLSDVPAELDAAQTAGLGTGLAVRPGNAAVAQTCLHRRLRSFAEVDCTNRSG